MASIKRSRSPCTQKVHEKVAKSDVRVWLSVCWLLQDMWLLRAGLKSFIECVLKPFNALTFVLNIKHTNIDMRQPRGGKNVLQR